LLIAFDPELAASLLFFYLRHGLKGINKTLAQSFRVLALLPESPAAAPQPGFLFALERRL